MIAIFGNTTDAKEYSDLVHVHLTANRPDYNAVRWSNENKAHTKNEFAVKLPPDLDKLKVEMNPNSLSKATKQIEKYPEDWNDQGENLNKQ